MSRKGRTFASQHTWLRKPPLALCSKPKHSEATSVVIHSSIWLPPMAVETSPSVGGARPAARCWSVRASAK